MKADRLTPKLFTRLRDGVWWVWLAIALNLAAGLTQNPIFLSTGLAICVAQFGYYLWREQSLRSLPVLISGAFAYLGAVVAYSPWRPLLWLGVGLIFLLLIAGYGWLARIFHGSHQRLAVG